MARIAGSGHRRADRPSGDGEGAVAARRAAVVAKGAALCEARQDRPDEPGHLAGDGAAGEPLRGRELGQLKGDRDVVELGLEAVKTILAVIGAHLEGTERGQLVKLQSELLGHLAPYTLLGVLARPEGAARQVPPPIA